MAGEKDKVGFKSQDIRPIVRIPKDLTVNDLAKELNWTPARTQKALYLQGGGILTNLSTVDFETARTLIRETGREAYPAEADLENTRRPLEIPVPSRVPESPSLWKQRASFWLFKSVEYFSIPGRVALETALVLTDMAVTQLILGAVYPPDPGVDSDDAPPGETPRFDWREILPLFRFPSLEGPSADYPSTDGLDPIEMAYLNDLHGARNDVIHNPGAFILDRETVYIGLFVGLGLAQQLGAAPPRGTPGLNPFMPALEYADNHLRVGCVHWLSRFIPSLIEPVLGPATVTINLDGSQGLLIESGGIFLPDLVILDQDGQHYSAQVEIPASLNSITAQGWSANNPSLIFIPLGYLARARSLARQVGFPENRLMAYISPAYSPEQPVSLGQTI